MADLPQAAGVYMIRCLANGRAYVGSAVDMRKRTRWHRKQLGDGSHCNSHLLRAWRKHGERAFEFSVVELVEPAALLAREQLHIDRLDPAARFNIALVAGSQLGFRMPADIVEKIAATKRGTKHTEATKAKMRASHAARSAVEKEAQRAKKSASLRAMHAARTPEARATASAHIAASLVGRKLSRETRQKLSATLTGKPRPYRNKLGPVHAALLIQRRSNGSSFRAIARELGVAQGTVQRFFEGCHGG